VPGCGAGVGALVSAVGPVVVPGVVWPVTEDDVDVSMATVVEPSVWTVGASVVGASTTGGTCGASGWTIARNVSAECDGEITNGNRRAPAEQAATTNPRVANRFSSIGTEIPTHARTKHRGK